MTTALVLLWVDTPDGRNHFSTCGKYGQYIYVAPEKDLVIVRLREEGMASRMLQVHDELLLEVPEAELAKAAGLVLREMKNAVELSMPLEVEAKRGLSWGRCDT